LDLAYFHEIADNVNMPPAQTTVPREGAIEFNSADTNKTGLLGNRPTDTADTILQAMHQGGFRFLDRGGPSNSVRSIEDIFLEFTYGLKGQAALKDLAIRFPSGGWCPGKGKNSKGMIDQSGSWSKKR
jgi:hypothetical protein